ncbi:hypothetical protein [Sphingobacterium sp. BN32]|uniref:AbiU2 domain-containing protein n=1 Tax=Sphingobacterium sp. BN32 TaxID=3058432 RepID=UPI00265D091D|nr:hypothetical protein [Sphingobacterium sp. BN32]WKK60206.1 hypothetical protein QYC40_08150 [Sphingobacterium sp. BN32]
MPISDLGKIYLLYWKSKVELAEAHLMRSPKNYFEKFGRLVSEEYDLDIFDFIVRKESAGYNQLCRNSWIIFVLEINKIISKSGGDKFSIQKFYNKLSNKEWDHNYDLTCFNQILLVIQNNDSNSTVAKLRVLRDKFYAHSDKDFNRMTEDLFPTYNEVWDLMFEIETFLKAIYGQNDSDIDVSVNRELDKYIREFQLLYSYFQTTPSYGDTYRIKVAFGEERFSSFRNNLIINRF